LAVVEAKAACKSAADGLQQAKTYAEMLGLKFAYATNGPEIIEFDYFTGSNPA
jgi:type I restriction enzyme, R subunit